MTIAEKGDAAGMESFSVREITYAEAKPLILNKHYAQRMPSVSYAFGLFKGAELVGVCTIGKPASPSLCTGLLGRDYAHLVYELNRLIVIEGLPKNTLSYFVGKVQRALRNKDMVIVSFADEGAGHQGYIYQATNFIYTGKTKERTDKYTPGNKHSRHYTDEFPHLRKVRTSKHRYVWFSRKTKKLKGLLKYPEEPFPKGENRRYELGTRIKTKVINKVTGEEFYE